MATVKSAWESLDIYTAAQTLKTFGTGILPSHYLEMIKNRLYQGDEHASWTIHHILKDFLAAFCPICPFFSHHISSTLYGESSLSIDSFPLQSNPEPRLLDLTPHIESFDAEVWKAKKERGLALNAEIEGIVIPDNLVEFSSIFTSMHNFVVS